MVTTAIDRFLSVPSVCVSPHAQKHFAQTHALVDELPAAVFFRLPDVFSVTFVILQICTTMSILERKNGTDRTSSGDAIGTIENNFSCDDRLQIRTVLWVYTRDQLVCSSFFGGQCELNINAHGPTKGGSLIL